MNFTRRLAASIICTFMPVLSIAQSTSAAAPAIGTFTGCAMPLADDPSFLTLCEKDSCELLRGKFDVKWAHHTVTLRGTLHLPDGVQPRTVEVASLVTLGGACNSKCKPPLTGRGVGKDQPGSKELGTPGETSPNPRP